MLEAMKSRVQCFVRNVGVESSNLFFSTNSRETVNPLSTNEIKVARDFFVALKRLVERTAENSLRWVWF